MEIWRIWSDFDIKVAVSGYIVSGISNEYFVFFSTDVYFFLFFFFLAFIAKEVLGEGEELIAWTKATKQKKKKKIKYSREQKKRKKKKDYSFLWTNKKINCLWPLNLYSFENEIFCSYLQKFYYMYRDDIYIYIYI